MKNKYSSVIVTGTAAYDEIMDFPGLFVDHLHKDKLHQLNVSFAVEKLEKQLGGTATNIAYNLKLINRDIPVRLLSAVGCDSRELIKFFRKNKIDIDDLIIDKHFYTSTGKVITDSKDNQIWGYYYGAGRLAKRISLNKYVGTNCLLIISANHADGFLHLQKQAINMTLPYLYDPGMSLSWINNKDLHQGIKHCRWLVGNDYEIAQMTKRLNVSINQLINIGVVVITTLGERGVIYQSQKESWKVSGWQVKKIVDPTGAGDAWRGGFIGGIVNDLSVPDCLRLANALASFAVEKYGTVNHRPTNKEINHRLKACKAVKLKS